MTNDLNKCDDIRCQLFELNATDSLTESMKKHLDQCAACTSVYQDILAINQGIGCMPEHDVSDEIFNKTLAAIQADKTVNKTKTKGINPQWATGLAASFVLVAVTGLIYNGSISEFQADFNQVPVSSESASKPQSDKDNRLNRQQPAGKESAAIDDELGASVDVVYIEDLGISSEVRMRSVRTPDKPESAVKNTLDEILAQEPSPFKAPSIVSNNLANKPFDAKAVADRMMIDSQKDDVYEGSEDEQDRMPKMEKITVTGSRIKRADFNDTAFDGLEKQEHDKTPASLDEVLSSVQKSASASPEEILQIQTELKKQRRQEAKDKVKLAELSAEVIAESELEESKDYVLNTPSSPVEQPRRDVINDGLLASVEESSVTGSDDSSAGVFGRIAAAGSADGDSSSVAVVADAAIKYLAELQATEQLNFKSATGYWANTYLPGDPDMRWIQAQLQKSSTLNLPVVSQNRQPFDYPTNAALGLFLNSDRKTLNESGPTRMRLQVGIQAGQQKGGHRSALNLAVVLDLGQQQPDASLKAESKALLSALLKAKQPADQISVYLADRGQIIAAADFKHGPIQVALEQVFSSEIEPQSVSNSLYQTLSVANSWLKAQDDPNAVLGSSAVLLVSGNAESTELSSIEGMVQKNAIDGITLSTVSLIGIDHKNQLERLALMGQGHSRVLAGVQDAQRLINEELLVSSRAVARALRLQIKLADGVQLIDVLDSYSLDEAQAQKVREAEQSLDQRMSKNLGITADRGQDDDGIQIVIPSYFAGDTHVILLDVLVQKPGSVAEVTAKYKDLIYLKNASSQKNLHLGTGENQVGRLELNVMKNVLTHRLSTILEQAGEAIRQGNGHSAVQQLHDLIVLYQAMRQHIPAWNNDAEMIQDETILKQYLQILNGQSAIDPNQYQLIADAMSYMSWRKLISHSP